MSGRRADRVIRRIVDESVARGLVFDVCSVESCWGVFCCSSVRGKQTPILSIIETLIIETWGDRGVNCVIMKHLLKEQHYSIAFDLDYSTLSST